MRIAAVFTFRPRLFYNVQTTERGIRMPVQKIMDPIKGHAEYQFDRNDIVSLHEAEERFTRLTGHGFSVVEPGAGGAPGRRLDKFDPDAEETVFIPALMGG